MEQVFLGSYIRRRREELGLTQAQLCEGICEPMTISRLETGKQPPSYHRIKALMERLGLPGNRYFALLSRNEMELETLRKEIQADVSLFERSAEEERPKIREQTLAKLSELERLADEDDRIVRQYILSSKVPLGKAEGPYSFEEQRDMLMEAIRLTVPGFDLEEINLGRYSMAETTIINQIARRCSHMGEKRKAIDIYRQLLRYIEENDQELPRYAGQFCLVAHNYAIELGLEKRYTESIEIAERGKQVCTKYGNYQFLPGFLAILAECQFFLGDFKISSDLYFQACCIYKAVGDEHSLHCIEREMYDHLGLKLPY